MSDDAARAVRIVTMLVAARGAFDDALSAYGHAAREGDPGEMGAVRQRIFDALAALLKIIEEAHRFAKG